MFPCAFGCVRAYIHIYNYLTYRNPNHQPKKHEALESQSRKTKKLQATTLQRQTNIKRIKKKAVGLGVGGGGRGKSINRTQCNTISTTKKTLKNRSHLLYCCHLVQHHKTHKFCTRYLLLHKMTIRALQ